VAQGQVVTVRFPAFDDTETFLLGSREEAATATVDVYSPTSPLGAAVLGRSVGETVEYTTPNGKVLAVEIISSETYTG
jgi:transcription elongation factor GreA